MPKNLPRFVVPFTTRYNMIMNATRVLAWITGIIWLAALFLAWRTYVEVPESDHLNFAVMITALGLSASVVIIQATKKK
jgi:hypothetical protein